MIWIVLIIIILAIIGMILVGKEAYKTGERNINAEREHHIDILKKEIMRLRIEIGELKYEKQKWETRFDEMEIRWRKSKQRQQEIRMEKLEIEAQLSDVLGLLNSEQEDKRSVATGDDSSNDAGKQKENP